MVRRLVAGVLTVLFVAAAAGPAVAGGSTPVLGRKGVFPNGAGFGAVKPRQVYLGGDPTGNVTKLRWLHWGSRTAVGFGTGWCPGQSVAQGHPCAASLHAYDLGSCHGHRAYRTLTFYFKLRAGGRWVRESHFDDCTGLG